MAARFVVLRVCAGCASGCVLDAKAASSPGRDVRSDHGCGDHPIGHDHDSRREHHHVCAVRHENRVDLAHDSGSHYGCAMSPLEYLNDLFEVAAETNGITLAQYSLAEDMWVVAASVLEGGWIRWRVWQ